MKKVNYPVITRDILNEQIEIQPPAQSEALSDAWTLIEEAWAAAENAILDFEAREEVRKFIAALERLKLMENFQEIMKTREAQKGESDE